jgi:hypothetical protein
MIWQSTKKTDKEDALKIAKFAHYAPLMRFALAKRNALAFGECDRRP